jgi:hypothetical protein
VRPISPLHRTGAANLIFFMFTLRPLHKRYMNTRRILLLSGASYGLNLEFAASRSSEQVILYRLKTRELLSTRGNLLANVAVAE